MNTLKESIAEPLLNWYDANKRILPFRTISTPYRVWVSEIMLQQTRVTAAVPYFERFMQELPTIQSLAECPPERLTKLWEGLGYYSRVRNLQKAAQIVMAEHQGALPADFKALKALPGIGEYTAGAIASISFGLPEVAVDGNVLRVFSRLYNDSGNILQPETKKKLSVLVKQQQSSSRPGDYNQALMELGALICLPNGAPLCESCPVQTLCAANKCGTQRSLPVKTALKKRKCIDYTIVFAVHNHNVLLMQRPEKGLLATLWQPFVLDGHLTQTQVTNFLQSQQASLQTLQPLGEAKHIFTHLEWRMIGYYCEVATPFSYDTASWVSAEKLSQEYALPTVFQNYLNFVKKHL